MSLVVLDNIPFQPDMAMLQQELRVLMSRVGLEQIRLPFDLAAQVNSPENATVQVSGAVH